MKAPQPERLITNRNQDTDSPTGVLEIGVFAQGYFAGRKRAIMVIGGLAAIVVSAIILSTQGTKVRDSSSGEAQSPTAQKMKTVAVKPIENGAKSFINQAGVEMVWIPPGSFTMGSPNGGKDEKPVHGVTISKGFYMGKYEVTQAQWRTLMGKNPSYFKGDNLPVENVSWVNVQVFIDHLNALNDGFVYRLPTESEWEYACRARTTKAYAGDLDTMAWYVNDSDDQTHQVGTKQPNAFGLYDMHGNVWEWCQDWYRPDYSGTPSDGSASQTGDQKYRVMRGGSWLGSADSLRSAARGRASSNDRTNHDGFRLVAVR
jgi:formylglycine-generating enzyme required for sulfatase activity